MNLTTAINIFLFSLFILSGCATTNSNRSQETVSSLNATEQQLEQIETQVDQTDNALDNVANADESSIEEEYDALSSRLSELEELKNGLDEQVEEIRTVSSQYLSNWRVEGEAYNNENLRSSSQERREELSDQFEDVLDEGGNVKRILESYISETREIESYLSNDLTKNGARTVASTRESAKETGDEVRRAINRMQQSISAAKEEMGAGGDPL